MQACPAQTTAAAAGGAVSVPSAVICEMASRAVRATSAMPESGVSVVSSSTCSPTGALRASSAALKVAGSALAPPSTSLPSPRSAFRASSTSHDAVTQRTHSRSTPSRSRSRGCQPGSCTWDENGATSTTGTPSAAFCSARRSIVSYAARLSCVV